MKSTGYFIAFTENISNEKNQQNQRRTIEPVSEDISPQKTPVSLRVGREKRESKFTMTRIPAACSQ